MMDLDVHKVAMGTPQNETSLEAIGPNLDKCMDAENKDADVLPPPMDLAPTYN